MQACAKALTISPLLLPGSSRDLSLREATDSSLPARDHGSGNVAVAVAVEARPSPCLVLAKRLSVHDSSEPTCLP